MSISSVVTRGYGNGTFNGTIKDVVLRGYSIGDIPDDLTLPVSILVLIASSLGIDLSGDNSNSSIEWPNLLLNSTDLREWTPAGLPNPTKTTVEDTNVSTWYYVGDTIENFVTNTEYLVYFKLKKDAVPRATRNPGFVILFTGGTNKTYYIDIDTSTGEFQVSNPALANVSVVLNDAGTDYDVSFNVEDLYGNTSGTFRIYPAWAKNFSVSTAAVGEIEVTDFYFGESPNVESITGLIVKIGVDTPMTDTSGVTTLMADSFGIVL